MLTPYSALFILSAGVLLSNFVFNTYVMKRPFVGAPVSYREYFTGSGTTHLVGMLGGAVWCLGTAFSYIAAGKAGAAISYALERVQGCRPLGQYAAGRDVPLLHRGVGADYPFGRQLIAGTESPFSLSRA